jgi:hypothetical protein
MPWGRRRGAARWCPSTLGALLGTGRPGAASPTLRQSGWQFTITTSSVLLAMPPAMAATLGMVAALTRSIRVSKLLPLTASTPRSRMVTLTRRMTGKVWLLRRVTVMKSRRLPLCWLRMAESLQGDL